MVKYIEDTIENRTNELRDKVNEVSKIIYKELRIYRLCNFIMKHIS